MLLNCEQVINHLSEQFKERDVPLLIEFMNTKNRRILGTATVQEA